MDNSDRDNIQLAFECKPVTQSFPDDRKDFCHQTNTQLLMHFHHRSPACSEMFANQFEFSRSCTTFFTSPSQSRIENCMLWVFFPRHRQCNDVFFLHRRKKLHCNQINRYFSLSPLLYTRCIEFTSISSFLHAAKVTKNLFGQDFLWYGFNSMQKHVFFFF